AGRRRFGTEPSWRGTRPTLSSGDRPPDAGGVVREDRAAAGQELTGVVEEDHAVAEPAPPLLGVAGDGAQYSKACEGASLPCVPTPPPPPLTCKNTGSCQPRGRCLGTPWLIYESGAAPQPGLAAPVVPGQGRLGPA